MARYLVEVEGQNAEALLRWFPTGDVHATKDGDSVVLAGAALDACSTAHEALKLASEKLPDFCGLIRLLVKRFENPTLGGVVELHHDGSRTKQIFLSATLVGGVVAHGRITDANNPGAKPGPTQAQELLAGSSTDSNFTAAIKFWSEPNKNWSELYRVLDEIEMALGCPANKAGLCARPERIRFKQSANNGGEPGKRHAPRDDPHPNPMTIDEATDFIGGILTSVLRNAAQSKP